jgi:hypothetical protein
VEANQYFRLPSGHVIRLSRLYGGYWLCEYDRSAGPRWDSMPAGVVLTDDFLRRHGKSA